MKEYADLELVGYLYNTCYGGFSFSDAFIERLNEQRVAAGLKPVENYYEGRTDPMVIKLFEEMGSEAASGWSAELAICYFPDALLHYVKVREYDGRESVGLDTTHIYSDMLHAFMKERRENPSLTLDDLEERYVKIVKVLARYSEYKSEVVYKKKD